MERRDAFIAGLRILADRLEAHPDAPLPHEGNEGKLLVMPMSADELAAAARCYGGEKVPDHEGQLALANGVPGLKLMVLSSLAGVCELVEVGTEEVEVEEVVTPAVVRTVKKVQPKFERRCPDSLFALADTAEQVPA